MMVLGGVRRDLELEMMSAGIRGCSEKSTIFRDLFWALTMRKRIFSSHKRINKRLWRECGGQPSHHSTTSEDFR
jgi:hypothetical protein